MGIWLLISNTKLWSDTVHG